MASLFRPVSVTYTLDGKHRTPDGRRVTKDTPGAVRTRRRSPVWWGQYRDGNRLKRRVALCSNKEAARQMLAKLVTDARLGSVGLGDDYEPYRNRLLVCPVCMSKGSKADGKPCECGDEHLSEFCRHLEGQNNAPRYIGQAIAHCRAVCRGIGAVVFADINAGRVADWLADRRRTADMGISTSISCR
jgi:hypothetical protein